MIPSDIREKVTKIARQTMEVAQSSVNVANGNTLEVSVPLTGIEMPDDIAGLVRSVAQSTGFGTRYTKDALVLSWTNVNRPAAKPPAATLDDVHDVLKEILSLQVDSAHRNEGWSRSEIIATLSFLLALIVAILGHVHVDVHIDVDRSFVSTHDHPIAQSHLRPDPSPEISPRLP